MKARLLAVSWRTGFDDVTLKGFFEYLIAQNVDVSKKLKDIVTPWASYDRLMLCGMYDDVFAVAAFMTVKNPKLLTELVEGEDGQLHLRQSKATGESRPAEFNYLIMNVNTGRGAYLYYHESCSFSDFTSFCRPYVLKYRNTLSADDADSELPSKRPAAVLVGKHLVSPKSLSQMIDDLAQPDILEITLGEFRPEKNWGQPIAELVESVKHIIRLKKDAPVLAKRSGIKQAIAASGSKKGRVIGLEEHGQSIVHLSRNAGSFYEYEFEEIVNNLTIQLKTPAKAPLVATLKQAMDKRKDYFILPAKKSKKTKQDEEKVIVHESGAGPA